MLTVLFTVQVFLHKTQERLDWTSRQADRASERRDAHGGTLQPHRAAVQHLMIQTSTALGPPGEQDRRQCAAQLCALRDHPPLLRRAARCQPARVLGLLLRHCLSHSPSTRTPVLVLGNK